ncbi:C6 zinc finger domain protein [Colletotrichum kahawae]|uniref:C6 zinc finger domain protein n=1 Tax=Colletotrichum kahawae TaxID=34407 RepID=A0AAD9XXZ0_COLKA|nr:C6 zinc finger domain protein [Colletotrichum kahawae]
MRVLMESSWQSSEVLFHTMQSMAAACLAKSFPELGSVAVRERGFALQGFDTEYEASSWHQEDTILMAGLLLGHTASWHNPSDLELEKFTITQKTLRNWVPDSKTAITFRFFKSAVEYWELLLSFFTETCSTTDHASGFIGPPQTVENLPHPFTGISDETTSLLARVGRLIHNHRKIRSLHAFITEELLDSLRKDVQQARRIERRLLAYKAPNISEMVDPEDPRTTLAHLSRLDEAYICSGLLQLYRVFPDLLSDRYNPWDSVSLYDARAPCKTPTEPERNAWLTSLAMYTLDLIREIPFESRTRCVQPFIFVAVAGELHIETRAVVSMDTDNEEARSHGNDAIRIATARNFITGRLSAYRDVLPLRKVMNISELIHHTWVALDSGKQNVYWLGVCVEKRLSTLFG